MPNNLSIEEQEVHITFNRTDDYAICYTSDSTFITLMDKRVKSNPSEFSIISETDWGNTYKFPKKYVSIRSKAREMSKEQKVAAKERMVKYHQTKQKE